jgi:predicted nucleotidyltransferase
MAAQEIIEILRRYLDRIKQAGLPVKELVLYGSYARDEARKDSDIDVLVLIEDGVRDEEIMPLWRKLEHLTLGLDTRIEPWPVTVSQYQTDEVSPLILIARQEGIPIAA